MRLIDADALKNKIQSHHYKLTDSLKAVDYGMFTAEIMEDIDESEIIEERKRGKWIKTKYGYQCSSCKQGWVGLPETEYCANCGAIMEGNDYEIN